MVRYTKDELKQMLEPMVDKFFNTMYKIKEQLLKCANNGAFDLDSVGHLIDDLQSVNTDMNSLLNKFTTTTKDAYTSVEKMEALKEAIESKGIR